MAKSKTTRNARRYSAQALEHMVASLEEDLTDARITIAEYEKEKAKKKAEAPPPTDAMLVRTNQRLVSTIMRYRRNMMGLRKGLERELLLKEGVIASSKDMRDLLVLIADQRMPSVTAAYQARLVLKEGNIDQTNTLSMMLPDIYNP